MKIRLKTLGESKRYFLLDFASGNVGGLGLIEKAIS